MKLAILTVAALALSVVWAASRPADIPFAKHTIDLGANEPCATADINGDGIPDLISGENWFQGPSWTKHKFRSLNYTQNYIEDFSDLPLDVNGDGNIDIVSVTWFAKKIWWNENPGKKGGEWKEHVVDTGHNVEFAFLVDLDNDGKALEVLPQFGSATTADPLAWYEPKGGTLVKHVVSPKSYGHGIGVGDINKDGRNDIITPKGWLEAPSDPRASDWTFHPDFDLDQTGFIYVLDVNGDGRPDLVTSAGAQLRRVLDGTDSGSHMEEARDRRFMVATACHDDGGFERRRADGFRDWEALYGAQRARSRRARTARHLLVRILQERSRRN